MKQATLTTLARFLRVGLFLVISLGLTGCDDLMNQLPVQQLGTRERGVVFRRLPTFLGGGVSSSVHPPGALVVVWPWDSIFRIDTGSRDVSLGEASLEKSDSGRDLVGFVFTRANDGNEVALKMTVRYRVRDNDETLVRLIQEVATSNEKLEDIIVAVARAAVRRYMNELKTSGFLGEQDRYRAVDRVRDGIQESLQALLPEGIEVMALMLDRFEFARLLPNGEVDRSYQEKLNEVLRLVEQTSQEKLRIQTVKEEGQLRAYEAQAQVNRVKEEALGIKQQAIARGDGYLTRKQNEAKSILALGTAEVQGIVEKIDALQGPGGAAILRMEVAKALRAANSQFVLMGGEESGQNRMEVQRVDTNDLLGQLGLFEAMRDRAAASAQPKSFVKSGSGSEIEADAPAANQVSKVGQKPGHGGLDSNRKSEVTK